MCGGSLATSFIGRCRCFCRVILPGLLPSVEPGRNLISREDARRRSGAGGLGGGGFGGRGHFAHLRPSTMLGAVAMFTPRAQTHLRWLEARPSQARRNESGGAPAVAAPLLAESHALRIIYPRIPDASSAETTKTWALPGEFRLCVLLAAGVFQVATATRCGEKSGSTS